MKEFIELKVAKGYLIIPIDDLTLISFNGEEVIVTVEGKYFKVQDAYKTIRDKLIPK